METALTLGVKWIFLYFIPYWDSSLNPPEPRFPQLWNAESESTCLVVVTTWWDKCKQRGQFENTAWRTVSASLNQLLLADFPCPREWGIISKTRLKIGVSACVCVFYFFGSLFHRSNIKKKCHQCSVECLIYFSQMLLDPLTFLFDVFIRCYDLIKHPAPLRQERCHTCLSPKPSAAHDMCSAVWTDVHTWLSTWGERHVWCLLVKSPSSTTSKTLYAIIIKVGENQFQYKDNCRMNYFQEHFYSAAYLSRNWTLDHGVL